MNFATAMQFAACLEGLGRDAVVAAEMVELPVLCALIDNLVGQRRSVRPRWCDYLFLDEIVLGEELLDRPVVCRWIIDVDVIVGVRVIVVLRVATAPQRVQRTLGKLEHFFDTIRPCNDMPFKDAYNV